MNIATDHSSFLSIGECMVEMSPAGDGLYRKGFAGDTFNTAWYMRRLLPENWGVSYATVTGGDAVSTEMVTFMSQNGIETDAIKAIKDRTLGLYLISLKNGERHFSYWRGQSAAKTLADDPAWLDQVFQNRGIIHFSGITLAILSPKARETLLKALAKARSNGVLISFDTNQRPHLWESTEIMKEALVAAAGVADIVLPSFDEEVASFGDQTAQDTIARYSHAGASTIIVKNGSDECSIWSKEAGTQQISPPKVEAVIDSTAAGDSFAAGFLAAYAKGLEGREAVEAAAKLASQVIGHRGALAYALFQGEAE